MCSLVLIYSTGSHFENLRAKANEQTEENLYMTHYREPLVKLNNRGVLVNMHSSQTERN